MLHGFLLLLSFQLPSLFEIHIIDYRRRRADSNGSAFFFYVHIETRKYVGALKF